MKGVKKRPNYTPAGLKVVAIVYAPMRNKYFAVATRPTESGHYIVEKLNKTGKFSKSTPQPLWSNALETEGQAKDAIRRWDLS